MDVTKGFWSSIPTPHVAGRAFDWFADVSHEIQHRLRASGCRVAANSRFAHYERLFRLSGDPVTGEFTLSREAMADYAHAMIDVTQCDRILRHLPRTEQWREKLQPLHKGRPNAFHDQHCRARSCQSELFLASSLARVGMKVMPRPGAHDPGDFELDLFGVRIGVEVKRITTMTGIEAHAKKASKQLRAAKLPGCIAFDLSHVSITPGKLLHVNGIHQVDWALRMQLLDFYRIVRDHLRPHMHEDYVWGVFVVQAIPTWSPAGRSLGSLDAITSYSPWDGHTGRQRLLARLQHKLVEEVKRDSFV